MAHKRKRTGAKYRIIKQILISIDMLGKYKWRSASEKKLYYRIVGEYAEYKGSSKYALTERGKALMNYMKKKSKKER